MDGRRTAAIVGALAGGAAAVAAAWHRRRGVGGLEQSELLGGVLQHMPSGVSIADAPSGRLLYHNDEAIRLLRHPLRESETFHGYAQYGAHHTYDTGAPYAPEEYPIARALTGEVVQDEVMPYLRGDGTWTTLEVNAAPVRDRNARIVAAVSTFHDIQRLVNAERELRVAKTRAEAARREAETANRAKSQFLAVMSHEIRTPLNAVLGYTDLLRDGVAGPLPDTQRSYLDRIKASGQHLLVLINDVLDLAKIEAGELRVKHEPVLIGPVAEEALAVIAPLVKAEGLSVATETDVHPVLEAWGDEGRIRQVLVNLLSNAVKFTEAGAIQLRTRVQACRPEEVTGAHAGPWVGLEVTDTGVGIPADRRQEIFEPFVQGDGAGYSRPREGSGLGLTISRRLARMMGGDLVVESEVGEGSTFTLWLPTAPPGDPRPPDRRSEGDRRASPSDRRQGDRRDDDAPAI